MLTKQTEKLSAFMCSFLVIRNISKNNNYSFSNHLGKFLLTKSLSSFNIFNVSQCIKWLRPVNNILLTMLARKWTDWIFSVVSFSGISVLKTQPTPLLYMFLHPADVPMDIPQPNSSWDPQGHSPFDKCLLQQFLLARAFRTHFWAPATKFAYATPDR